MHCTCNLQLIKSLKPHQPSQEAPSTNMVEETETPAGVSKAKGGRRGKTVQPRGGNEAEAKVHGNDAGEETNSDSDLDDDSKQYNF